MACRMPHAACSRTTSIVTIGAGPDLTESKGKFYRKVVFMILEPTEEGRTQALRS